MSRYVTERDFRMPEFQNADPADYEFRGDGKLVRKDRWETGMRSVASDVGLPMHGDVEILDVQVAVGELVRAAKRLAIEKAADDIWWTLRGGSLVFDQPF